jgi:uncharacterized cupredoxin-like copper-binding protein
MDPIDGGTPAGSARRLRFLAVTACLAVATIGAVGWSATRSHGRARSGPVAITVTETDAAIRVSTSRVAAGAYSLVVRNEGTTSHELVVFRVARPNSPVPTFRYGGVDEHSPELEKVADTGAGVLPGATRTLGATLRPGRYVLLCNLPGHYQAGMRVTLTVR